MPETTNARHLQDEAFHLVRPHGTDTITISQQVSLLHVAEWEG